MVAGRWEVGGRSRQAAFGMPGFAGRRGFVGGRKMDRVAGDSTLGRLSRREAERLGQRELNGTEGEGLTETIKDTMSHTKTDQESRDQALLQTTLE